MLLLVWIKTTTSVFDSPAASYSCGQTIPWQYEERLIPATIEESPLYKCLQVPDDCRAANYYRDEGGIFEEMGLEGVSFGGRLDPPPPACSRVRCRYCYVIVAPHAKTCRRLLLRIGLGWDAHMYACGFGTDFACSSRHPPRVYRGYCSREKIFGLLLLCRTVGAIEETW